MDDPQDQDRYGSYTFETLPGELSWAEVVEKAMEAVPGQGTDPTFGEASTLHEGHRRSRSRSARIDSSLAAGFKALGPIFEGLRLSEVTAERVLDWRDSYVAERPRPDE
ncbi:hypothetical protein [Poseidonocella sp. HB161398]|uniref:hypothetical protein n=1 Tax=Poseidonocella sp. HB161398 TaxID=2320855 RepID=UPI001107A9E0|nr:hypothetical protein [Poseidonocella sp. HB161398]